MRRPLLGGQAEINPLTRGPNMSASGQNKRTTRNPAARWFRDRRVGVKIGIAVGACVAIMAIQGVHDLARVGQLADATQTLYSQDAQTLGALGDARASVNRMRQRVLRLFLAPGPEHPKLMDEIRGFDQMYDDAMAKLKPLDSIPDGQLQAWAAAVTTYRQFRDSTLIPAADRGVTAAEAQPLLAQCDKLFKPVE